MNAYEAMHRGGAELNLRPWLYRIAHNTALNALRDRGLRHDELDERMDGVERPDQALERTQGLRDLLLAVQALPERQRDAIPSGGGRSGPDDGGLSGPDDDRSGPGGGEEPDEDNSGPGGGGDDPAPEIEDAISEDHSGPGGGGGDDSPDSDDLLEPEEPDNSGPG